MKKIIFTLGLSVLLGSLSAAQAQVNLTAWTFDNVPVGANSNPSPSTGFGLAGALGMGNSFNNTNSISNPDVQSLPGSSTDPVGPNAWRIRGNGAAPNGGNGWSSSAPIGTQGAQFSASTAGFYKIKVSFDVFATQDAEANLLVQYTTEGTIWQNATITSVGTLGVIANNSATNSTVMGSYVILTNNGATGWNNQIVVDLSGIPGVDNNANFAIRLVNASTGTNCVDTTGAALNNVSGNWTFDNVIVQGSSFDNVTEWTFESEGKNGFVPHPVPEFGSGTASSIGFDTTFHFSDGSIGSTNDPDTLQNGIPFSSTGSAGQNVWRCRGQGPGNGWDTQSPIGSQGAEFDVSTVNFTDIILTFDMFSTSQGEAKMCVEYTTDGWATTNNATTLYYAANPTYMFTNVPSMPTYSPDTVTGTYFQQNVGQNFFNNFTVDFTGVSGATNNPLFGFRIVNAAQNNDCVAFNGGSYNNSSGNWRFDNVAVNGHFIGSAAPALAFDPNATVDHPFTNTFTDDPVWRASISSILANGVAIPKAAYNTNFAGKLIFTPSAAPVLKISGTKSIVIFATGYSNAKLTQPLQAGVATSFAITAQPQAPSASGGTLAVNPAMAITDQFGNGTTNPFANVSVSAAVGGTGAWTLGGATSQSSVGGFINFSNLTATVNGSSAVSGAFIAFTVTGFNSTFTTNSTNFTIGAPPVAFTPGNIALLQIDTLSNNTTFSIAEVKSSVGKQTTPVNIVPITATGTNALRMTTAGTAGRLSTSDDGTLVVFNAFKDDNAWTPDETFVLSRGVGTLNYTNQYSQPVSYTSTSLGGSQARAATTIDNTNFFADDKGGLFVAGPNVPNSPFAFNTLNNIVVKSFDKQIFVETQKTANGSPIPVVYGLDTSDLGLIQTIPNNLATDPIAVDFSIISTNNGSQSFPGILYIVDQTSGSLGDILKYSWVPDNTQISGYSWAFNGSFTNGLGGDSLFATTNASGTIYLYMTTGGGGTAANSLVRFSDSGGYNGPLTITSSNVIYTSSATTSIKGVAFVPQQIAYTNGPMPAPVLVAQSFAATNATFSVTNSPEDPLWRNSITGITVNGSLLPAAAYNTNVAGQITFDPSQSALLQSPGSKTIVISASGFSTNSVTQVIAGIAAKLAMSAQPKAPAADGAVLATQPVVIVEDAGGNPVASSATITGAPVQATWSLSGSTALSAVGGTSAFSGLKAFSTNSVTGATISFTTPGLTSVTSSTFNIPAPLHSKLKGITVNGTGVGFSFTNFTGLSYTVLGSSDITAPLSTWQVIGAPVEGPAGTYIFTNSTAATNGVEFYYLRQP